MHTVKCTVQSVKGFCSAGYKVGDTFYVKQAFIVEAEEPKTICLHALSAMTLPTSPPTAATPTKRIGSTERRSSSARTAPTRWCSVWRGWILKTEGSNKASGFLIINPAT